MAASSPKSISEGALGTFLWKTAGESMPPTVESQGRYELYSLADAEVGGSLSP